MRSAETDTRAENFNGGACQRKLKRHQLAIEVDVYDHNSETFLGRLVNIHSEGLMLVGEQILNSENLYQLELRLPLEVNGHASIFLGVDCLWVRNLDKDELHWTGCRIIDISDQGLADIAVLIELLGV